MISLTRRQPLGEMVSLRRALDDAFSQPSTRPSLWGLRGTYPALDVYETADDVVVKAVVPGIKPEDIEITITKNVLTIKGQLERQEKVGHENYLHRERLYGSFSRTIVLPDELDAAKSEAGFENGVLTLTIPKAEEAKPRSIKVKIK